MYSLQVASSIKYMTDMWLLFYHNLMYLRRTMLSDAGSPPLDKISDRRPRMRKTTKESLDYMSRTVCRLSRNNFLMCLWMVMLSGVGVQENQYRQQCVMMI